MTAKLPSQQIARLAGHTGPINALTYSAGTSQYLLSGSSDRTINLYNPSKASPTSSGLIQSYTGAHGYEVLTLSVASDNSRFASGGGDKTVFLWDVATAKTLRRFGGGTAGGHGGRVECVAFGGEGDAVIVSGSYDSTARLWDCRAQGNRPLMVLSEAGDSVGSLICEGWEIVTGSVDGRCRCYDVRMGTICVDVLGQPVTSLTQTADTSSLLISTLDSTLRLLDKSTGKLLNAYIHPTYLNNTYRTRSMLGANDALILAGSEDGYVYSWDVLTGEMVGRVKHVVGDVEIMRSSRKVVGALAWKKGRVGEWASAGGDGAIVVWGLSGAS